jgi:hypothetical protein
MGVWKYFLWGVLIALAFFIGMLIPTLLWGVF